MVRLLRGIGMPALQAMLSQVDEDVRQPGSLAALTSDPIVGPPLHGDHAASITTWNGGHGLRRCPYALPPALRRGLGGAGQRADR